MHENTKDWDKAIKIDCDNLRRQFYELDYNKRYVMPQNQVFYLFFQSTVVCNNFSVD